MMGTWIGLIRSGGARMPSPFTSKVFLRWIGSYLAIMVIPVVFGGLAYFVALQNVRTGLERVERLSVQETTLQLGMLLRGAQESSYTVLSHPSLPLVSERVFYGTPQYRAISRIQQTIIGNVQSSRTLSDILLYLPRTNYLLSKQTWIGVQWSPRGTEMQTGLTTDEFLLLMDGNVMRRVRIVDKPGIRKLLFVNWIFSGTLENRSAPAAIVSLNTEAVDGILQAPGASQFLVDPEGNILSSDGSALPSEVLDQVLGVGSEEARTLEHAGSLIWIQSVPGFGVSLVRMVPASTYRAPFRRLLFLLYAYIGFCLALGGLLAYLLSRRQYSPIRRIVEKMRTLETDRKTDEIGEIDSYIDRLEALNERSQQLIAKRGTAYRNTVVGGLLKGRIRKLDTEWNDGDLQELGMTSEQQGFALVCLEIEDIDAYVQEHRKELDQDSLDAIYSLVRVVSEERFGQDFRVAAAEVDGSLMCLINLSEQVPPDGAVETLTAVAKGICEEFRQNLRIGLAADVSRVYCGRKGIHRAYEEINELIEFRDSVGTNRTVLRSTDIETWEEYKEISVYRKEKSVRSLLGQHRYDEASLLLEQLMLQKEEMERIDRPTHADAHKLIHAICSHIIAQYRDTELSAGRIAEAFRISPSYLSQLFRKEKGMGVLDFINGVRVEAAKGLLEQGRSIRETAVLCGYYNPRPFQRAFRKICGMLPSEYKDRKEKPIL